MTISTAFLYLKLGWNLYPCTALRPPSAGLFPFCPQASFITPGELATSLSGISWNLYVSLGTLVLCTINGDFKHPLRKLIKHTDWYPCRWRYGRTCVCVYTNTTTDRVNFSRDRMAGGETEHANGEKTKCPPSGWRWQHWAVWRWRHFTPQFNEKRRRLGSFKWSSFFKLICRIMFFLMSFFYLFWLQFSQVC